MQGELWRTVGIKQNILVAVHDFRTFESVKGEYLNAAKKSLHCAKIFILKKDKCSNVRKVSLMRRACCFLAQAADSANLGVEAQSLLS